MDEDIPSHVLQEIAESCSVTVDAIQHVYTCTPLQVGIMAQVDQRTYSHTFVFSLEPSLDKERFSDAVCRVVADNSVLRTRIVSCELGLQQVVVAEELEVMRQSDGLADYLKELESFQMHLHDRLLRIAIVEDKFILVAHHAIVDSVSLQFMINDVSRVYHVEPTASHAEFSLFTDHCRNIDEEAAKSFWSAKFHGQPGVFPVTKTGYTPEASQQIHKQINHKASLYKVESSLIPSYIQVAWGLTVASYLNTDNVAYGLVYSGRTPATLKGLESTLGPTITTIPTQMAFDRASSTIEKLIRDCTRDRSATQASPALQYGLLRIRQASEAAAAAARFTTLLNILARDDDAAYGRDLRYEYEHGTRSPYSLGLVCTLETGGSSRIAVQATFDAAVLPRAQMERVLCQFEHILQLLVRSPKDTVVGRLPLVGVRDRREMLGWNTGTIPDDGDSDDAAAHQKCLHELFGEQARARPNQAAVAAHDGSLTFAELDELSGALAQGLRQRGVVAAEETAVALLFEKSVWATVAQLGVLKAGGVCVPIDPGYPAAQRTAIITTCNAKLLLTSTLQHGQEGNVRDLLPISTLIVDCQTISDMRLPTLSQATTGPGSPGPSSMAPSQAAFILFTSGSTGAPKGVVLEHRNLAASLTAFAGRLGWAPGVRVLQFAASVWGASIIETLGTLLAGGCVCVPSDESRASGLAGYVAAARVECAILTPTVIRLFSPRDMPTLKTLCSAGEAVDVEAARTWSAAVRFFNGWGQSETSVCSSLAEWPSGGTSPYPHSIGTPVGCAIWIADEADVGKLAPIGAVGQLVIEGPGVTRGYLHDEAKTKGSFIPPQPWTPRRHAVGGLAGPSTDRRLYRTGDLARYYADGSIEYIGRQSSQVKVRGQRFDLQEVEKAVVSHAAARGAFAMVVQAGPDGGQEDLVAVVTLSDSQFPRGGVLEELVAASSNGGGATAVGEEVRRVREYLAAQLPGYMVPTAWLVVQELPRTASAKLDRNRLREWVGTKDLAAARMAMRSLLRGSLTPPATAMEKVLHSSWAAVLSIPEGQIGRESSLLRLGADSVTAMRIASLCRQSGVLVTVATLLRSATLSEAAAAGEWLPKFGNRGGDSNSVPTDVGEDEYLVSSKSSLVLNETELANSENPRVQMLSQHLVSIGIPISEVQSVLPCTSMQDGILFAQMKGGEDGNDAYWNTSRIKLSTDASHREGVDPHRLAKAWQALCDAQPILRTFFLGAVSDPDCAFQQVILKDVAASISQGPLKSRLRPAADFPKPEFAPTQPPHHLHLTRVSRYVVYATIYINHALMDERSMAALGRLLRQAYADAAALEPGPDLSEYVAWDRGHRASAREYWTRYLSGVKPCQVPVSAMPVSSKSAKPSSSFHDAIPRRDARSVHEFCKQQGITLANLVQVAWGLALTCCTAAGGDSVCFGSILSQQSAVERGESTLGPLLAMVVCSLDANPNNVVSRLLERARDDALAVLENGGCPMSEMHDQLGMGHDAPLFNTAMTIARTRTENLEVNSDMKMEYLDVEENPTEYPLTIGVGYDQETYGARIWCDETKIPISYASEVGSMFASALNNIIEHPGQSVQTLTARLGKPTTVPADVPKSLEHSVGYESSVTSTSQDLCSNTPSASSVCGTEALSDTEAELRQLWSQVLSVPAESIERTGNFFDLGGNSIRAMRLVNNAREAHLSLTVANVFKNPVLSDLAALVSRPTTPSSSGMSSLARQDPVSVPIKDSNAINAAPDAAGASATTTPVKELHRLAELASQHHCFHHDNIESVVPVTDAQAFMLAVSELDGKSLHNKAVIKLSAGLDTTRLARACEQVVQHQALLRTIFVQEGPQLYQAVLHSLPVRTVTFRGDDDHHVQPKNIEEARYLPRFQLQTDNPDDSDSDSDGDGDGNSVCDELHLHIHHALYDAISLGLVLQDLRAAYMGEGTPLSDTPKFSDWVLQVGSSSSSSPSSSSPTSPSSSDDYWRQLLSHSSMTTLSPPTLPVRGGSRTRTIAFRTQTRNLKTRHGLPSSALSAAWAAALHLATGARDLVFGAANANRSSGSFPHAFQVPGPCLNLLPVRATLPMEKEKEEGEMTEMSFGSLIEQLQDQATSGIPHQHVGFRSIARRCTDWPSWTRLGSVLVYQNYEAAGHSLRFGDEVEADFSGEGTIGDSTDFWIIAKPVVTTKQAEGDDGDLDVEILYSSHRVSEEQARWVGRCLESVLGAIPTLLDQPLESFRKLVDGPVASYVVPAVAVPEPVAMPTTPTGGDDARPRHPPPTRRRANTVLASVSAILEQPLDSFRKLGAADGPVTPPNPVVPVVPSDAATIDGTAVANNLPKINTAIRGGISDARSAPQTPSRRRAHSVLESVSTLLKQPLESFQNLMESPTSTPVHVRAAAAAAQPVVLLSDGEEASSRDEPKKQARSLVALAWEEVGLLKGGGQDGDGKEEAIIGQDSGDEDEDGSLFDCGGDLETVLLLSWWYRYRGHGVSMYDIIENPTRRGQWELLRKGLMMG